VRVAVSSCLLLFLLFLAPLLLAQSTDATISGVVVDPSGKVVPDVDIAIVNDSTRVRYASKTNGDGIYTVPILPPGEYRVQVSKIGFKTIIKPGIILNVQSAMALNFTLPVGAASESITVEAGSSAINTADASVSTVVDQKFVENMPLNGRSLQSLISLAPGVVQTPLPYGSSAGNSGEFSINGQRTEANYYTVDGVSANVGVGNDGTDAAGPAGLLPSQTTLGTTQSMVSIDALQEFRINTSTYSAEYGRTPGGQISLQTRSGTDELHGTLSDYFRNDALDANNWFNDHTAPITAKTAERQNDFGGTVGGPVYLPHLYDGRHRTFFFYSYEGLRLTVPSPATTTEVPDTALRETAAAGLQPLVDGFPVPNGTDVGGAEGLAYFTGAYSVPSRLDTNSVRLDHALRPGTNIFGRYSNSISSTDSRAASNLAQLTRQSFVTRSLTSGLTHAFGDHAANEARYNYSWTSSGATAIIDSFGGAQPATLSTYLPSTSSQYSQFLSYLFFGSFPATDLSTSRFGQTQANFVDTQQFTLGKHSLKIGVDYRRLETTQNVNQFFLAAIYFSPEQIVANNTGAAFAESFGNAPAEPIYTNVSAFAQDEWKLNARNSLSLGLRWDVNPPPNNGGGRIPPVLNQITDLAIATLAPEGTPEWKTDYAGFAPRIGFASQLSNRSGSETILRAGLGEFFDSGNTLSAIGFTGLGFGSMQNYASLSFPLPPSVYQLPAASTATPYNQTAVGYARNLKLPYTLEWNLSLEQALGASRSFTLGYVASTGRRLLAASFQDPAASNPAFALGNGVYIIDNVSWANYNSLQAQFQQHLTRGLQVLASMTWSHSIDNLSNSFVSYQPLLKGASDFDIRNNFQIAATYDAPAIHSSGALHAMTKGWSADVRALSRTAEPVDVYGAKYIAPNGTEQYSRPNLVPQVPLYVYGPRSEIPGGRAININAFQPVSDALGDAPRNFVRGFGANEIDFAARRQFEITSQFRVLFRAEAFNILNHPNFGAIYNTTSYGPAQFGQAYNTLNVSLANQSPLYEQGGPRSLQLALKILF
jgi:hypothetical protein